MVRGTYTKGLVLLAVICWTASADGAPTLNVGYKVAEGHGPEVLSSANSVCALDITYITGLSKSYLTVIGPEFHKPTVSYSSWSAHAGSIKSLPPVPGTLLLSLLGFLFVTTVNDRKMWLAAAASVLCAGQTGLVLLPHLASHLDLRKRCLSSFGHATGAATACLLVVHDNTESTVSLYPLVVSQGNCGQDRARRSAGIQRARSCDYDGCKTTAKHKMLQAAIWAGLCCLDYGSGFRGQQTGQYLFSSRNGFNSRLSRGPPR